LAQEEIEKKASQTDNGDAILPDVDEDPDSMGFLGKLKYKKL